LSSASAITSIAVLPFTHDNREPNTEYLSSGITENLINNLSQSGVRVLSRNTVLPYRGREIDPRVAGRELQVDGVLTGRVTPHADMLDIQAELVDVATGAQLWGRHYTRPLSALLSVQDQILRDLSETLRLTRTAEDERRIAQRYPANRRRHPARHRIVRRSHQEGSKLRPRSRRTG
jgi:TolB-like protein